ncbi:hypothetical protein [Hasllibacter sp. MH4015]|uniref:hypothetical protein n=1 Tax=Hasllibacter sp. MH4015 TaxID=2854029 RepID=UPI001CD41C69|nr:hypothetical protein [Hasllibacter sp. MH4015]
MRAALALLCLSLAACAPGMPELHQRLSVEARAAEYPQLVPLGPLLSQVDAPAPRAAAREGLSLEARAEALRRRAAWLRNMPL